MIAAGLLWYDDDLRRPLAVKLAEASERYRERVGYEPTTCLLNPAQIPAAPPASGRGSRKKVNAPAITLNLVSDEHLRPNYFFVGVGADERPKRVRGWRGNPADEQPETMPTRRVRQPAVKQDAGPKVAKRAAVAQPTTSAKPAAPASVAAAATTPAPPTKRAAGTTRAAAAKAASAAPAPNVSQTAPAPAAASKRRAATRHAAVAGRAVSPEAHRTIERAKSPKGRAKDSANDSAAPAEAVKPRSASKTTAPAASGSGAAPRAATTATEAVKPDAAGHKSTPRAAGAHARTRGNAEVAAASRPARPVQRSAAPAKSSAPTPAVLAPQRRRKTA